MSRAARAGIVALGFALAVGLAGAAAAQNFGADPVAERYFRIEQQAVRTAASGRPKISGYIYNTYDHAAGRVRLLVEGLDAAGQPVSRAFSYVGGDVPAEGRRYFQVAAPTPAATYRVTVVSFEWVPRDGPM